MNTIVRDFSISMRTTACYQQVVSNLLETLKHRGFEILCEFLIDRELDRKVGLRWEQLGLRWQHYTVFVVRSPFDAYQALLSDRDGGLLVPFNVCVAQDAGSTFVAVTNHQGSLNTKDAPIGIQVSVRDLARKIRQVLMDLAMKGRSAEGHEVHTEEAHRF